MKALLLLICCTMAYSSYTDDPAWRDYKLNFGKTYDTEEEAMRYTTWMTNLKAIDTHNSKSGSFKQGVNKFTDMTHEEFRSKMGGCYKVPRKFLESNLTRPSSTRPGSHWLPPNNVHVPGHINWAEKGYVTDVKDQGMCGSCWAFSTTGSLEGQTYRRTGKLPILSEQNLVDCSKSYGNDGCNGGLPDLAFNYILDNGGIDDKDHYPYYGQELEHCFYQEENEKAKVTGWFDIRPGNETELMIAVATVGPISVAIDASHRSFQLYESGVYFEETCGNTEWDLDHAVLAVGYGVVDGQEYWLIKNSWGVAWGDKGYIKMARNRGNHCGIATAASFPTV